MDTIDTALYFPYIQVPKSTWFTQVLLYWDAAASIVPYRERDKTKFSPYMSQLIKARLLQPITAKQAFRENANTFDQRFLDMLDSRKPQRPDSRQETRIGKGELSRPLLKDLGQRGLAHSHKKPGRRYETREEGYVVVHRRKGPGALFGELADRGLAYETYKTSPQITHHVEAGDEWWAVEKSTADLYMNYLVGSICRIKGFWPVTDSSQTLADLAKPIDNTSARLAELRYETIMQALPIPSQTVPPLELARFKEQERNQELLRRLRNDLNGKLVDLLKIKDEYERQVKKEYILQSIHDDVARLTEQMSRQPWPRIVFGGVAGVVAAGLMVGATIASGGGALVLGLGIGGTVVALGQAGYQAQKDIRPQPVPMHEPLAYAALAARL